MKRAAGFTLVEVLLALVLMSMLLALAYGGLTSLDPGHGQRPGDSRSKAAGSGWRTSSSGNN